MHAAQMFPGLDGLLTLSKREGLDIRPTLLRVLTDLYVQTPAHSSEEQRCFAELASRLIPAVDDATRAVVRARLSIYPQTPPAILAMLTTTRAVPRVASPPLAPAAHEGTNDAIAQGPPRRALGTLAMQPNDASDVSTLFIKANAVERLKILHNLAESPVKASAKILEGRAGRALQALEAAAFAGDRASFVAELAGGLMLPDTVAAQIVDDKGGEPLACACKALGMSSQVFQRVLMFLDRDWGASVTNVYRVSRLYDVLSERAALVMLAAWRGATYSIRHQAQGGKHQAALYDDERGRARPAPVARPAVQPGRPNTAAPRVTAR